MTAKEYVKHHMPKAKSERHVAGGRIKGTGKPYWLIRNGRETMYFAQSDVSESNAWVVAKAHLFEQLKEKISLQ